MFSIKEKRQIADAIQRILRATENSELSDGEIPFHIYVDGFDHNSWANIYNNGVIAPKEDE